MSDANPDFKPQLCVPGNLNAFFGLVTNVLLNVLIKGEDKT